MQYLTAARTCDLLVLIVGSEMSAPTRNEYLEAFADNSDKVLAFYVGLGGEEVAEFRSLIDSRHSRTQVADTSGLAPAVSTAVETAVANGRVSVPSLRRRLVEGLAQADRLLDLDPALAFVPLVIDPMTNQPNRLHEVWGGEPQIILVDIGGAGKTYASLAALFARSQDGSTLPMYIQADPVETDIFALIIRAFDAVRFQPGNDNLERYGREGRIAVCVDGIDQLDNQTRARLLESIDAFGQRFPRVRLLVPTRALPRDCLTTFARVAMAPLSDEVLVTLFDLHGQPGLDVGRDLPPAIVELAQRPFFAGVLATTGLDAETGLVVLERLVERRLRAVVADDQSRLRLRFVLGELARAARPAISIGLTDAYDVIAAALGSEAVVGWWRALGPTRSRHPTARYGTLVMPTLAEASKRWRESRIDVEEQTSNMHRSAFARIFKIAPALEGRRIDEITVDDVTALVAALAAHPYKRETVRKTRTALAQCLDHYTVDPTQRATSG